MPCYFAACCARVFQPHGGGGCVVGQSRFPGDHNRFGCGCENQDSEYDNKHRSTTPCGDDSVRNRSTWAHPFLLLSLACVEPDEPVTRKTTRTELSSTRVTPGTPARASCMGRRSPALVCGVCRSVAAFCDRFVSLVADDEDAGCGFDDVVRDRVELVDFEYAIDLGEESFEEAEVAAGDPFDGGDGLCVGEVVRVESLAESFPVAIENEKEFFAAEGAVLVGESESAV